MASAPRKEMITGNAEGSGAFTAERIRCSETQILPQAMMSIIYGRRTAFYKALVTFKSQHACTCCLVQAKYSGKKNPRY